MSTLFVPDDFHVPPGLKTDHFRLEPLGLQHNERDHEAWMSSIEHIRNTPGFPRGKSNWPSAMPLEKTWLILKDTLRISLSGKDLLTQYLMVTKSLDASTCTRLGKLAAM